MIQSRIFAAVVALTISLSALAAEERPGHHLLAARARDCRLADRGQDALDDLPVRRRHGHSLAIDRTPDVGNRRTGFWHAVHGDAIRHRLPQPPARQLPRRMARGLPLRPDGLL